MQTLKLLSAFFKVNVQMSLAYRADTIVNILLNLMWLGWELLSLNIIFNNTDTLGGWGLGETAAFSARSMRSATAAPSCPPKRWLTMKRTSPGGATPEPTGPQ